MTQLRWFAAAGAALVALAVVAALTVSPATDRAGLGPGPSAPNTTVAAPGTARSSVPAASAVCDDGPALDRACVSEHLGALVASEGAAAALGELAVLASQDEDVLVSCHGYAHEIGEAAATVHPDLEDASAQGSVDCQFGYYHGLFVGRAKASSPEAFAADVPRLCDHFPRSESFAYSSCIHGIGHAAVALSGPDLPGAVRFCGELADVDAGNCANGAVMEFATSQAPDLLERGEPSRSATLEACSGLPEQYHRDCYREISTVWLAAAPGDFAGALDRCDARAGADQDQCYLGVGFRLAMWAQDDPGIIEEACATGDPEVQVHCYGGAAVMTFEVFQGSDPARAESVCPAVPAALRAGCEEILRYTRDSYAELGALRVGA